MAKRLQAEYANKANNGGYTQRDGNLKVKRKDYEENKQSQSKSFSEHSNTKRNNDNLL